MSYSIAYRLCPKPARETREERDVRVATRDLLIADDDSCEQHRAIEHPTCPYCGHEHSSMDWWTDVEWDSDDDELLLLDQRNYLDDLRREFEQPPSAVPEI